MQCSNYRNNSSFITTFVLIGLERTLKGEISSTYCHPIKVIRSVPPASIAPLSSTSYTDLSFTQPLTKIFFYLLAHSSPKPSPRFYD